MYDPALSERVKPINFCIEIDQNGLKKMDFFKTTKYCSSSFLTIFVNPENEMKIDLFTEFLIWFPKVQKINLFIGDEDIKNQDTKLLKLTTSKEVNYKKSNFTLDISAMLKTLHFIKIKIKNITSF
jgi:hypothetical protein